MRTQIKRRNGSGPRTQTENRTSPRPLLTFPISLVKQLRTCWGGVGQTALRIAGRCSTTPPSGASVARHSDVDTRSHRLPSPACEDLERCYVGPSEPDYVCIRFTNQVYTVVTAIWGETPSSVAKRRQPNVRLAGEGYLETNLNCEIAYKA